MDWNEGIYPFFSIEIIVHCQLACSIFLSVWESIEAQFRTFVPPESKLLWRKLLLPRTTKSSVFSRSANFGNVSPFLAGAINTLFCRAYPSTHKTGELCFEILQFIRSARLFRLPPPSRSMHRLFWRTATSIQF